eukprot:jgi/Ulvmu1/2723/UM014_0180.1
MLCGCCSWRSQEQKDRNAHKSSWQAHEDSGNNQKHESLVPDDNPSLQKMNGHPQTPSQPTSSPADQPSSDKQSTLVNDVSNLSSTTNTRSNVTTTAAAAAAPECCLQHDPSQGSTKHHSGGKWNAQAPLLKHQGHPPHHARTTMHADMSGTDDEELEGDPGPGPTGYDASDQEELIDPQQNAMLNDIHLQQAAGITEMIQGVKESLMKQQTLNHKGGDDGGLEIFNSIGTGGFGDVYRGRYRDVCHLVFL